MRGLRLGISGQSWNKRTCICLAWLRKKRTSESLNKLLPRVALHLRIYRYSISYDIEKDTNVFTCVFDVMYSLLWVQGCPHGLGLDAPVPSLAGSS